jgi:hypothetical protein
MISELTYSGTDDTGTKTADRNPLRDQAVSSPLPVNFDGRHKAGSSEPGETRAVMPVVDVSPDWVAGAEPAQSELSAPRAGACIPPAGASILTVSAAKTTAKWQLILEAYFALVARQPDISYPAAAGHLGVSVPTLHRIVNIYAKRQTLSPALANCGRKPPVLPTDDELACVREIYIKLDESEARGRGLGSSKVTAYRLAAKSDDPRITETFRAVVLKRNRKTVPPSWLRLLDTPASVIASARDSRTTAAHYINTPRGRTYIDEAGQEIPLRAGTIFEADDGTLNFYAWIPWPFGGDKCSDKFGVRLGRWQLLAAVDGRWEMCVGFDIVARERSSYRGEDSSAIIGRIMLEVARPELWRLERGSWESKAVRGALDLCQQRVQNAWHSKQKSAVERFFDRLWTPASLIPGHVGRDQARAKQTTELAMACQDGRKDPRQHFISLDDATSRVIGAVQFINSEPIESRSGWGRWIPEERFAAQMAEHQPARLDKSFAIFFAREQRVWTVRGCVVGGNVQGPLLSFPIYFQHEALWQFEGCKVKAFFDPYTSDVTGTLVLAEDFRGCKAGHIIATEVPALELPPQVVLAADGWAGTEEQQRQLAVRKAIGKAVRTEKWNYLGGRRTEARDGFGNLAVRGGTPAAPALPAARSDSAPTVQTPARDTALGTATVPASRGGNPFAIRPPSDDQIRSRREKLAHNATLARQRMADTILQET